LDRLAAWKFIESFLSPLAQSRLNQIGLFPVVGDIRLADPRQEVLLTQALTALAGGVAYPVAPEMALYLAPLDAALQSVIAGNRTPAEALSAAEQAILVALAQAVATPTP
jgi:maltose-binding protein MalE